MEENYIVNQVLNPNSDLKPIDNLVDIGKSICKIITHDSLGTGFLIKLERNKKPFYCLMTNEHVITQEKISNKETIKINYDNQHKNFEIKLDKNERFIQDYLYLGIDATIIEILLKDNIPELYFLLPNLEYLHSYEIFKDKKIYIFQFPKGGILSYSIGTIKEVNIYKKQMSHLASTLEGSSGSPIIIYGSNLVLGIHKQANLKLKENYGNFIGPIIDALQKDLKIGKIIIDNCIYEGELAENKINEVNGKLTFKNGEMYIGQLKNDRYNGKGVLYYKKNKAKYEGDFLEGKYDGKGKLIYENKEYYIGQFKKGKKDGFGEEYYNNNKLKYKGGFKNNLYNGEGILFSPEGYYYIGGWANGKKFFKGKICDNLGRVICDGNFLDDEIIYGKICFDNGDYYEGQIKNWMMNGNGIYYYENGKIKYDGFFKDNKIEGEGILYSKNGDYYIGNFKNGKRHGKGIEYNKDNIILYEGTFENNEYEGSGRCLLNDGKIYIGEFKKGKKEGNGIILDKNNNIIFEGEFIDDYEKGGKLNVVKDNVKLNIEVIREDDLNRSEKRNFEGKININGEQKNVNGCAIIKERDSENDIIRGKFIEKIENEMTFIGEGEYKNKYFYGKVKLLDENHELIYEGDYVNGKKEGNGKIVYQNGKYYIGEFKEGERNGNGTLFDNDNSIIYEGQFKNDEIHGKGKLYHNNEIIYEGDLIDGKVEGFGKEYLSNGTYYIGEFKNYEKNGKGKIYGINDNIIFDGFFIDGKPEGKGRHIFHDNGYYIGEFKRGQYDGKGKIYDNYNQLKYEGEFRNGKYEGYGQLFYKDGKVYIGEFKNGKEKGKGILLDKDNKILYEGEFNGEFGIGFHAKMALFKIKNLFG